MRKFVFVSILAISTTLFSCRAIIGLSDEKTGNSTTPSGSTPTGSTPSSTTPISNSNKEIIELTSSKDFSEQVEQSKGYVIVDFYKGWCINCLFAQYAFYQLAKECPNVKFCSAQAFGTPYLKGDNEYESEYEKVKYYYSDYLDDGDTDFLEHWLSYECGEAHMSCSKEARAFPDDIPFEGKGKNSTPTILLYKDGKPIARLGAGPTDGDWPWHTKDTVKEFLDKYVE